MDTSSLVPQVEALARSLNKEVFTVSELWKVSEPKPPDAVWYIIAYTMAQNPGTFTRLSSNKWQLVGTEAKTAPKSAKKATHGKEALRPGGHGDNDHDSGKRVPAQDRRALAAAESAQAASAGS
jgi:hypothetical protein